MLRTAIFGKGSDELTAAECLGIALICSGAAVAILGFFPALYWLCKATGRL